jgi:hypothetical protein
MTAPTVEHDQVRRRQSRGRAGQALPPLPGSVSLGNLAPGATFVHAVQPATADARLSIDIKTAVEMG